MRNPLFSTSHAVEVCSTQEQHILRALSQVNWKAIAFWVVLWWLVYSAPTERSVDQLFFTTETPSAADSF